MATFDVFTADGFTTMSLTDAINLIDFKPQFLGSLGIFMPRPVRTVTVAVESRGETLALVPTTPRGAPPTPRSFAKRELRNFRTSRLKLSDRIMADELQDIRAFGSETELEAVMAEVSRRQQLLIDDIELTTENMRLGAVQGIVTDADSSVIVDYFSEFGIAQPAEIAFDLANTVAGALRPKVEQKVTRPIMRAGKGLVLPGDIIHGLCGDAFWDELRNHAEIRDAFKNRPGAEDLLRETAFGQIDFAGVRWSNYRGTDDESTVAVPTDKVKFFPGSRRVFEVVWSPGESFDMVNQLGQRLISRVIPDRDRQEWADVEVASYPLYICKRPNVLLRGRRGV